MEEEEKSKRSARVECLNISSRVGGFPKDPRSRAESQADVRPIILDLNLTLSHAVLLQQVSD